MIVDCKTISKELREKIKHAVSSSKKDIRLAIIKARHDDVYKDVETEAFLKQKHACGREVGIDVREYDISDYMQSQSVLERRVSEIARITENDAVIIQLPLPNIVKPDSTHVPVNTQAVLNSVPPKKDADVLHAESCGRYEAGSATAFVPPVVGALEEILRREAPDVLKALGEKIVVVVGQGLVIGRQINRWAIRSNVVAFTGLKKGSDIERYTQHADIIVSGVGTARLITRDMVKEGCSVFDFGFSKEEGIVRGDIDAAVVEKARLLTPVPGGMGPLAVTMLFWNVARICRVLE